MTIDGQGHTIDLGGKIRFLKSTTSGINLVLKNLIIKNGYNSESGGAVYIKMGNIIFINSTFTNNTSPINMAGAVYLYGSSGSFVNCTFVGNNAKGNGGAVYIERGNSSFINSTFTNTTSFLNSGGTVFIRNGNGSFINSTFTNNNAIYGGAVRIYGNGSFVNSTFISNNGKYGGAVAITGNSSFINSTFISNNASMAGAVYINGTGSFINSTFISNNASMAGAVYINGTGSFINSTFTGNKAKNDDGGAVYLDGRSNGTAILCRFNTETDTIYNLTVIPASINVLNYTSTYQSGEKLEFNLTADDMVFDGFNTTIDIFKDGVLVNTFYGLTGEGWIVDLNHGVYTAVLSLTSYPSERSSNATINISKENTTVTIVPIVDAVVGKEILINYTTNSNGTVTIKINYCSYC